MWSDARALARPDCDPLTFLSGDLQRLAVAERAFPPPRREHFVFEATVDHPELYLEGGGAVTMGQEEPGEQA